MREEGFLEEEVWNLVHFHLLEQVEDGCAMFQEGLREDGDGREDEGGLFQLLVRL